MKNVDLTVIGGGINAAGIAAEAASRGLKTLLIHDRDIADAGSAHPAALTGTHLEQLSALDIFQLNTMLDELCTLNAVAPHLIDVLGVYGGDGKPLKESGGMVEKYLKGIRDRRFAQLGNHTERPDTRSFGARLRTNRLIISKALQAQKHGACLMFRHEIRNAKRQPDQWLLEIKPNQPTLNACSQQYQNIASRVVVNCAGERINELLADTLKVGTRCKAGHRHRTQFFFQNPGVDLRLGTDSDGIYRLDNYDANMAFYVYPVGGDVLCFGPRKSKEQGQPSDEIIEQAFIDCWNQSVAGNKLSLKLSAESFLYRRHTRIAHIADPCSRSDTSLSSPLLDLNNPGKAAVLLNVFGVDPALQRRVSHQALEILRPFLNKKAVAEFAREPLPGSNKQGLNGRAISEALTITYPHLPMDLISRFASTYGDLSSKILGNSQTTNELGHHFGNTLYAREVIYLLEHEWAICADDILKRRSLLGMELNSSETEQLDEWIQAFLQQRAPDITSYRASSFF